VMGLAKSLQPSALRTRSCGSFIFPVSRNNTLFKVASRFDSAACITLFIRPFSENTKDVLSEASSPSPSYLNPLSCSELSTLHPRPRTQRRWLSTSCSN
jgi:hypothetical protein